MTKRKTSFTLSADALRLLAALAALHGLTRTAALEMLIRQAARMEGLAVDDFEVPDNPGSR